jgi:hypothetical protein
MWTEDEVVSPKESEWFGYHNSEGVIMDVRATEDYLNDNFGLKTLDDAGKLWFYKDAGNHMHMEQEYMDKYLLPLIMGTTPTPSMNPKPSSE